MRLRFALALSTGAVWIIACSGQVTQPEDMLGSGGASLSASGGAVGSGGSGTGGIDIIDFSPMSTLTNDCELTAQSNEWGRDSAEWQCFSQESFSEGALSGSDPFPTFPNGGAGMGGVGGAESTCPRASDLDWTCQVYEGRCCPTPQCEEPKAPEPVDGECCYVVYRACGV